MKLAKVSIIIPVYNIEKYLERCLDSVLAQSYTNLEVLVVDDGSTDQSLMLLERYARQDARVSVIQKANGGQASARNLALKQASGDYILMVDGDDYILPHLVAECVEVLESGVDIVVFDYYTLNKKKEQNYTSVGNSPITAGTAPWNKMYVANLWQDVFFPEGYWYEDLGVVPFVMMKSIQTCKIDRAFYVYDQSREDSQTNTVNIARYYDILAVLEHLEQQVDGLPGRQTDMVAAMYIEQLGYVMTLNKSQYIKEKKERRIFLKTMQKKLEKKCPDWYIVAHKPESKKLKLMRRMAMKSYFKGYFLLGDMFYIWPKKIKERRSRE
ncbi:glycosyltransferase family 2 protein [Listeria newyorkensis]|uniref:Glycosyltransferase family 2 protein n=1 Tax=Listeria newyorkensis TaxID=1497681 RepID=A0A841YVC6_9LIST|nr:glycosyltransferase family A protein [Listeria newyorkensis]MBC1457751.1 glycosyltransferase family 2 protein [Listeria newyorkensis]